MKKIVSLFLVAVLSISIGINASATTTLAQNTELDLLISQAYDEYRNGDNITGEILEKYDEALNGSNNIDYVVLATSMSEEKDDRISAMKFLISIYDAVTDSEKEYLKSYLQSYAPYSEDDTLISFCNDLKEVAMSTRATYSRDNAVNYAKTYYKNFNSNYPDLTSLGGDCANFVSQCLLAGGKTMSGDWYIYKKNANNPKPTTVDQLNASWRLADPSPWISAKEFNNYWSDTASETFLYKVSKYEEDHSSIYSESIYKGDAIQLLNKTLWWYEAFHTMIIVGYDVDNRDFIYAQHSGSAVDKTILENVCGNSNYTSKYIKFFSM